MVGKKKVVYALLVAGGIAMLSSGAHAYDGTIDFSGQIVDNTCLINGNQAPDQLSVVLPTVSKSTLPTVGAWGGRTPFQIKLTQCPVGANVATYFEPDTTTNFTTGTLKNTIGTGAATGVEVRLRNKAFGKIQLGKSLAEQGGIAEAVDANGNANLNYFAEYEAIGVVTSGQVASRVAYTLQYQ
ncbi:type 1 fimbrial protein [Burkholderia sp. JSH-S8]|nr:type 1 fimbrial protein [Burkholderia sp. JSH-S8]